MTAQKVSFLTIFFALSLFLAAKPAQAVLLDFETLTDLEKVTTQFSAQGATFTNATAALAFPFGTLNEINFPPSSGNALITNEIDTNNDNIPDSVGDMGISFGANSYTNVSGYFTYADFFQSGAPLMISVFSPTDTITPLVTSSLFENLGSPQFISFSGIGPIGSLLLQGGIDSYYTLDNFAFSGMPGGSSTVIPEPSTALLFFLGLVIFFFKFNRKIDYSFSS